MVPSYFLYDSNKPDHFSGSELGEWSRVLADTDAERQSTRERAMGNQFLEMPVHCQKAAAMQASFSIDSAFGFSLSEKSPNKTSQPPEGTRHGSGSLETGHSPSDTLLAITANATYETASTTDCDITNCAVEINDFEIPGFADASSGGDFGECARRSGVNNSGIHQAAADLVVRIARVEGISTEALAVTWQWETGFNMYPLPNINGSKKNPKRYIDQPEMWDVGPFHINVKWTKLAILKGEIDISDIELPMANTSNVSNVYGVLYKAASSKNKSYLEPSLFGGDPYANGRVAARRIKANLGTEAEKVAKYAPDYQDRLSKYNEWGPKFRRYFDCYER